MSKEVVDNYFAVKDSLFNLFDYKEDWHVYPVVDYRHYWWSVHKERLWFSRSESNHQQLIMAGYDYDSSTVRGTDVYTYAIRIDRFIERSTWESFAYSMILCDTQTDGNVVLGIFDKAKRLKRPSSN